VCVTRTHAHTQIHMSCQAGSDPTLLTLQLHLEETCAWLRCLSLNSSARAEALLAQRSAAGGRAVGGGAARQQRVPAAERREIWRAMQVGSGVPRSHSP
jgi:hypothetical protein